MPLYHDEDQAMLAETAEQFMAEQGGIQKQLRHWRDRNCKDGFGHELWKQFAEMGFTGILVGEDYGGLDMGHVEAGIVLEEIGRNLTPSPFLSSSVLAATALQHGSDDVKTRWLPDMVAGEKVYAVAIDEGPKHRPERIACKAEKSGNGFRLSGKKDFVVYGASAEMIVVAARTSGSDSDEDGVTLFAVPQDASGMSHDSVRLVDSSMASHITFDGVELDGDAVIGEVDGGRSVLNAMLTAGRVGAAAEGVGVARGAMDMTVDYLKQRKQFGTLIGSFQALQHRAADLWCQCEVTASAIAHAGRMLDSDPGNATLSVSLAKARATATAKAAVIEGVQMHGGIGMTDEFDMGFFMKRARAGAEWLGDYGYHAEQVARLRGF